MSNSKKVIIPYVVWILFLVLIFNIIPISQSAGTDLNTACYADERTVTIEKETTDAEWSLSKTVEVDFTLSGSISGYDVTTPFEFELTASFEPWKTTRIKYEFLCNGEISRIVQEDLEGTNFNYVGSYEDKPLRSQLLKVGANSFTLKISVVSTCDRAGWSSFKLLIKDLKVRNHVLDLDGDGIWDTIDSIPLNNYIATAFLGIVSTPIVGYAGLILGKRIEKLLSTKRTET